MTLYVAGLWRYPAKTLAGEGLPATVLELEEIMNIEFKGTKLLVVGGTSGMGLAVGREVMQDGGSAVIITAAGIASGVELGFHLLRRAGSDERFVSEVARVMEYHRAYELYRGDLAIAEAAPVGVEPA